MKGKAVIPLVLGLAMGFVAIKMGVGALQRAKGKPVETVGVVVAAKPIDAASALEEVMLKVAQVPLALAPPGCFADAKKLVGRVLMMPMATGMPLSIEMLAPEGSEPGLPSQIPGGFRAVSVPVDESTSVGGFVMPGHRVDVYAQESTMRSGQNENRSVSKMLLEDVQVGAVGQSIKMVDPDGKTTRLTRSVTLYVKPEDVPALDIASRAAIRLALRGSQDRGKVQEKKKTNDGPTFGDSLAKFMSDANKPRKIVRKAPEKIVVAQPPAPPKPFVVEVYRGQTREQLEFATPRATRRLDAKTDAPPSKQAEALDKAWIDHLTDGRVPPPVTQEKTQ